MDKKKEAQIIREYANNKGSYRMLGKKHGVSSSKIHRIMKTNEQLQGQEKALKTGEAPKKEPELPADVELLKAALRQALLKIELQDLMIDISGKELGVDLRKKHGTRQSR